MNVRMKRNEIKGRYERQESMYKKERRAKKKYLGKIKNFGMLWAWDPCLLSY